MRAEIISIGTELLIGSITNTNARFLSEQLARHAIDVYHQVTVGDNAERLVEAFETAAGRSGHERGGPPVTSHPRTAPEGARPKPAAEGN